MARIPVECIAIMNHEEIRPIRLRYEDSEGKHVIKIDAIQQFDKKKVFATMNNPSSVEYTYKCETIQDGIKIPFKLTFNDQSCRWVMYT